MINKDISNLIEEYMMDFSAEVLLNRAIPSLYDGLKISYRRILWAMKEMNVISFKKSMSVAGRVMFYHPHSTTYPTIVSMVQKDNQLHPLLDGKGNFGQYTSRDLAPAADRYTEIKLSDFAIDMLKNLNKNFIEFKNNYDGTLQEPEFINIKFPYILLNAQEGIAIGFSSKLPSFNLSEVCDEVINYLNTNKHNLLIPDFATGGYIIKDDNIFQQLNNLGRVSLKLRAKIEAKDDELIITELPYGVTREAVIDKIVNLIKDLKIKEVLKIHDLTGLNTMAISLELKRNIDKNLLIEKLYKFTPLENTYNCNMNVLINNLPRVLGVNQIIEEWLIWRRNCIKKELNYKLSQLLERINILESFKILLNNIDEVINIIKNSKDKEIEDKLKIKFKFSSNQASYIANMKMRNMNKFFIEDKILEIDKLNIEINKLKKIINSEKQINKVIIKDLIDIKQKYGKERQTKIIEIDNSTKKVSYSLIEKKIEDYEVFIYLTKDGYCYKYRNEQNDINLKPGDIILDKFKTNNNKNLIIFDNKQNFYKINISLIQEMKTKSLGLYLPTFLELEENKLIIGYTILDNKYKYIIIIYKDGKINKLDFRVFNLNKKIVKNAYSNKSEVFKILTLKNDIIINLKTKNKVYTCNTENINLASSRLTLRSSVTKGNEIIAVELI